MQESASRSTGNQQQQDRHSDDGEAEYVTTSSSSSPVFTCAVTRLLDQYNASSTSMMLMNGYDGDQDGAGSSSRVASVDLSQIGPRNTQKFLHQNWNAICALTCSDAPYYPNKFGPAYSSAYAGKQITALLNPDNGEHEKFLLLVAKEMEIAEVLAEVRLGGALDKVHRVLFPNSSSTESKNASDRGRGRAENVVPASLGELEATLARAVARTREYKTVEKHYKDVLQYSAVLTTRRSSEQHGEKVDVMAVIDFAMRQSEGEAVGSLLLLPGDQQTSSGAKKKKKDNAAAAASGDDENGGDPADDGEEEVEEEAGSPSTTTTAADGDDMTSIIMGAKHKAVAAAAAAAASTTGGSGGGEGFVDGAVVLAAWKNLHRCCDHEEEEDQPQPTAEKEEDGATCATAGGFEVDVHAKAVHHAVFWGQEPLQLATKLQQSQKEHGGGGEKEIEEAAKLQHATMLAAAHRMLGEACKRLIHHCGGGADDEPSSSSGTAACTASPSATTTSASSCLAKEKEEGQGAASSPAAASPSAPTASVVQGGAGGLLLEVEAFLQLRGFLQPSADSGDNAGCRSRLARIKQRLRQIDVDSGRARCEQGARNELDVWAVSLPIILRDRLSPQYDGLVWKRVMEFHSNFTKNYSQEELHDANQLLSFAHLHPSTIGDSSGGDGFFAAWLQKAEGMHLTAAERALMVRDHPSLYAEEMASCDAAFEEKWRKAGWIYTQQEMSRRRRKKNSSKKEQTAVASAAKANAHAQCRKFADFRFFARHVARMPFFLFVTCGVHMYQNTGFVSPKAMNEVFQQLQTTRNAWFESIKHLPQEVQALLMPKGGSAAKWTGVGELDGLLLDAADNTALNVFEIKANCADLNYAASQRDRWASRVCRGYEKVNKTMVGTTAAAATCSSVDASDSATSTSSAAAASTAASVVFESSCAVNVKEECKFDVLLPRSIPSSSLDEDDEGDDGDEFDVLPPFFYQLIFPLGSCSFVDAARRSTSTWTFLLNLPSYDDDVNKVVVPPSSMPCSGKLRHFIVTDLATIFSKQLKSKRGSGSGRSNTAATTPTTPSSDSSGVDRKDQAGRSGVDDVLEGLSHLSGRVVGEREVDRHEAKQLYNQIFYRFIKKKNVQAPLAIMNTLAQEQELRNIVWLPRIVPKPQEAQPRPQPHQSSASSSKQRKRK